MFQFDATREDELSIQQGDTINVNLSVKTDEGWIWGECNGRTGVFPIAFAAPSNEFEQAPSAYSEPPPVAASGQAVAIADYVAAKDNHLSFRQGSVINLREKNGEWWSGEMNGKIGWFPETFVNILTNTTIMNTNGNASIAQQFTASTPIQPSANSLRSSQSTNEISSIKSKMRQRQTLKKNTHLINLKLLVQLVTKNFTCYHFF